MTPKLPPTAQVPSHQWVEVQNLQPINNKNVSYSFGDTCSIDADCTVKLLARDGNNVLVRAYRTDSRGAECPNGAIFFLSVDDYATMTASAMEKKLDAQKRHIAKLLGR